jgi:hypothetical protein
MPPYAGETIQLDAYAEMDNTAAKTRTGLTLNIPDAVKSYELSTTAKVASLVQAQVTHSGAAAIEISGIGLEIDAHGRPVRPAR